MKDYRLRIFGMVQTYDFWKVRTKYLQALFILITIYISFSLNHKDFCSPVRASVL